MELPKCQSCQKNFNKPQNKPQKAIKFRAAKVQVFIGHFRKSFQESLTKIIQLIHQPDRSSCLSMWLQRH